MTKISLKIHFTLFTQSLADYLDDRQQIDVFIDFAITFDRIDYSVLLHKLSQFGFYNAAFSFRRSYSTERRQFFSYNGFQSYSFFSTLGILQSSNLGPPLFVIFLNDLSKVID